jgi:coenzyme F420-reducing hydrogenase beta subunit
MMCLKATLWTREEFCYGDIKVLGAYQAKSKDMEVLSKSQDGGLVTTLAIKALERGLVDAVVLAGTEDKWLPKPVLALKPDRRGFTLLEIKVLLHTINHRAWKV